LPADPDIDIAIINAYAVTVTGADTTNDVALCSLSNSAPDALILAHAAVTAADTVTAEVTSIEQNTVISGGTVVLTCVVIPFP
jgi:hypothetical protein